MGECKDLEPPGLLGGKVTAQEREARLERVEGNAARTERIRVNLRPRDSQEFRWATAIRRPALVVLPQ
jgi:hypothetical protein